MGQYFHAEYHHWLQRLAKSRLKQYGGKWIPAKDTQNLPRVHEQYKAKISAVKYRDIYVGFTALTFYKREKVPQKNQAETPYSEEGWERNIKRTKKKRISARLDEVYSDNATSAAVYRKQNTLNNFEFIMNQAYALNWDKLKCRVCGGWLIAHTHYAHRINLKLPLNKVNRVNNLVSLHWNCFQSVNNPEMDITGFDVKA